MPVIGENIFGSTLGPFTNPVVPLMPTGGTGGGGQGNAEMTLEQARKIINTTGSSQEDVLAANAFLNAQAKQTGLRPSQVYGGQSAPRQPLPTLGEVLGVQSGRENVTPEALSKLSGAFGAPVSWTPASTGPYNLPPTPQLNLGGEQLDAGLLLDLLRLPANMGISQVAANAGVNPSQLPVVGSYEPLRSLFGG